MGTMLIFDTVVLKDLIAIESMRMDKIEVSQPYRQEIKEGRTGLRGKPMGPSHEEHAFMDRRRTVFTLIIYFASTLMVVPVIKSVVPFFDCVETEGGTHRVNMAVEVEWLACGDGVHRYAGLGILVILTLYLYLVIP